MAANSSYETSWADQWDPEPLYEYNRNDRKASKQSSPSSSSKFSCKMGETFDKTKVVASTGVKKAKAGASAGFQWIKDKYHKTTNKH
nr:CDP-diacylglycerol-glycerol-3-phosphate 3-phosphatidyltransferase [Ipomoea batatas]GMD95611.1 CDP-diacylglycerol-glycerol-3-phosphate 3-phosphatidyltransferase [Ipomoea batatas]